MSITEMKCGLVRSTTCPSVVAPTADTPHILTTDLGGKVKYKLRVAKRTKLR